MSLESPNKGSNCEGKILAYKKSKLCLISILYIKNINEEYFIGYKAHARDVLYFCMFYMWELANFEERKFCMN